MLVQNDPESLIPGGPTHLPLMSACQSRIRHGPTSTPDFPLLAGMEISAGMGGASCREHAGPCQPAPTSDRANTHYTFGFVETVSPPISLATNLYFWTLCHCGAVGGPGPNWPGGGGSFTIQLGHRSRAVSWAAILGAV